MAFLGWSQPPNAIFAVKVVIEMQTVRDIRPSNKCGLILKCSGN
jgi:hypothetical protein